MTCRFVWTDATGRPHRCVFDPHYSDHCCECGTTFEVQS